MSDVLKVLGIIIAFGGASLLFYGLLMPILNNTSMNDTYQLCVIFGGIISLGGFILFVKNR